MFLVEGALKEDQVRRANVKTQRPSSTYAIITASPAQQGRKEGRKEGRKGG